jgi:hypothetical protein
MPHGTTQEHDREARRRSSVEVKIGVQHVTRELVLESAQSPDDVKQAVTDALAGGSATLELVDDRGRVLVVPTANLAYVEIGAEESRRVGFGS